MGVFPGPQRPTPIEEVKRPQQFAAFHSINGVGQASACYAYAPYRTPKAGQKTNPQNAPRAHPLMPFLAGEDL